MIRSIVIDDEDAGVELVKTYINKTKSHQLLNTFTSPLDALEYIKSNEVHVIYLDIEMPDISGLDFVQLLDRYYSVSSGPKVIFSTGHRSYALDSFRYDRVLGFLKKPYSYKDFAVFASKLERAFGYLINEASIDPEKFIILTRYNNEIPIPVEQILYVSSEKNSVLISLRNGDMERFYMPLYEIEEILPSGRFIRIHKSYIVAKSAIESIRGSNIKLYNLRPVFPIGRKFSHEVNRLKMQKRYLKEAIRDSSLDSH